MGTAVAQTLQEAKGLDSSLERRELPPPPSQVLGLQVCATRPGANAKLFVVVDLRQGFSV